MKNFKSWMGVCLAMVILVGANSASAQLKLGYINSQKIGEKYKDAQDAQKQIQDLAKRWQDEAKSMQQELQTKLEELESQALLLSDERKKEKENELQNLDIRLRNFQEEKFGNQGELYAKNIELMQPVINRINDAIKKVGLEEKFDYIFDTDKGGILHVSDAQPNLTDKVLEELNKSVATTKPASTTSRSTTPTPKPKN